MKTRLKIFESVFLRMQENLNQTLFKISTSVQDRTIYYKNRVDLGQILNRTRAEHLSKCKKGKFYQRLKFSLKTLY